MVLRNIFSAALLAVFIAGAAESPPSPFLSAGAPPPSDPLSVNTTVLRTDKDSFTAEIKLLIDTSAYIYSSSDHFFKISFSEKKGLGEIKLHFPESDTIKNFDGTFAAVFKDTVSIGVRAPFALGGENSWSLSGMIGYQACTDDMCLMPSKKSFSFSTTSPEADKTGKGGDLPKGEGVVSVIEKLRGFTIAGKAAGYMNTSKMAAFLEDPEKAGRSSFSGKSIWLILLIIVAGGFLLNLTPCVLPMIPVTLAVIGAGAGASSRRRGFLLGLFYGAGMALSYGFLGAAAAVTGAGIGGINSSPVFNIAVGVLFIILALGMFDIISIDFSSFRRGGAAPGGKSGFIGVFFLGVLAAVLAGACVAPVVISVIIYSASLVSQGNTAGLFLPFLLGAGMALPWPFAGAGLTFLPKPGKWMARIKWLFGILILVMAAYYIYSGINIIRLRGKTAAVEVAEDSEVLWIKDIGKAMEVSENSGKPLFIDFYASWCKNCKAMDATVFREPEITGVLNKEYVSLKYRAEDPSAEPHKTILSHFGIIGFPEYIVLYPQSR
ncbi:MAG: protein-disulfide reductase DsbD family protein [Fibrobacterota bacterium]